MQLFQERQKAFAIILKRKKYDLCDAWVAGLKLREGKGKRKNVKHCPFLYLLWRARCMLVVNITACEWKWGSATVPDWFVLFEKALNTDVWDHLLEKLGEQLTINNLVSKCSSFTIQTIHKVQAIFIDVCCLYLSRQVFPSSPYQCKCWLKDSALTVTALWLLRQVSWHSYCSSLAAYAKFRYRQLKLLQVPSQHLHVWGYLSQNLA